MRRTLIVLLVLTAPAVASGLATLVLCRADAAENRLYEAGCAAGRAGMPYGACPYDGYHRTQWLRGWNRGWLERIDQDKARLQQ
jgi:ribosome modulation factor